MPEADADAQVLLHPLAEHHPVGLVDLERQSGSVRVESSERDAPLHAWEERLAHLWLLLDAMARHE